MDTGLDELLRALAHPSRRAIIARCVGQWVPAGTLVDELELAAATVSEHLKVLRKTGFVEMAVEGTWRRYRSVPRLLLDVAGRLSTLVPTPEGAIMTAPIVHFDISGPDDRSLQQFYERVLDWTVVNHGPGYSLVDTPAGLRGAIVEAETNSLSLGVAVADLAAHVEAVVANGGTVIMPPTDNGWVTKALIADPAGNLLTLIQS